jgi:hypothetical protein
MKLSRDIIKSIGAENVVILDESIFELPERY